MITIESFLISFLNFFIFNFNSINKIIVIINIFRINIIRINIIMIIIIVNINIIIINIKFEVFNNIIIGKIRFSFIIFINIYVAI